MAKKKKSKLKKFLKGAALAGAAALGASALSKRNQMKDFLKTEGGDTTANAIEFAKTQALVTALTRTFNGAKTEAGRALNILKQPVKEGKVPNLNLDELNRQEILMQLGGKEQILAIAELYGKTKGISKQNAFLEKSWGSKTSDAAVEIFLNNIESPFSVTNSSFKAASEN